MPVRSFPKLDPDQISETRDALHAYSRIAGHWLKQIRARRKHWWHASLRPSLNGLSTGVVYGATDFEMELDLRRSELQVRVATGNSLTESLRGQSAVALAEQVQRFLAASGAVRDKKIDVSQIADVEFPSYSVKAAQAIAHALNGVAAQMSELRARLREESSPIQLWPHHFDLSMIWLPGHKVVGQDPADEEYADKQMNFGFTFGDEGIPEPYFYVTAYPLPAALPAINLPPGAQWKSDGFSGAVLLYRHFSTHRNPSEFLQAFWSRLHEAGQRHLATDSDTND
ncbi:MAG: DUF5996 family protein [Gammaproteobacteria bacterium]